MGLEVEATNWRASFDTDSQQRDRHRWIRSRIMTADVCPAQAARLALRAACLFAVVGGIFAMHGLATHGVTGSDLMPHSGMDHSVVDTASDAVQAIAARPHITTPATPNGAVPSLTGRSHDNMDMGMAGLCLAILLIGVGTLLVWLARHRPSSVVWVVARASRLIERAGRFPRPPPWQDRSIQRC